MKKNWLKLIALLLSFTVVAFTFTSCDDEDEDPPVIETPDYGMQITGTATGDAVFVIDQQQMAEPSSDFTIKEVQAGMFYGIYYLTAGDAAFSYVAGDGSKTAYGVADLEVVSQSAEVGGDDDAIEYTKGSLVADGTAALSVSEEGLYYIIADETNMKFWTLKIEGFEISAAGELVTMEADASASGAVFTSEIDVPAGANFKVRINKAWKFVFEDIPYAGASAASFPDDHARPIISYGGTISDDVINLEADGGDMTIDNVEDDQVKKIVFTFTWDPTIKGIDGFINTYALGSNSEQTLYPENLYMIGGSLNGWDWGISDITMIPVIDNPHLFYSIVWLNGSDDGADFNGIKFATAQEWGTDFGVSTDPVDYIYDKGGDNAAITASGTYMVVVNLLTEKIEVNPAPAIYAIGDAFGSWDAAVAANIYTVDNVNKVLVSPVAVADGALRTHATSSLFTDADGNATDWWRSELSLVSGSIEYRTGDELSSDAIATGQSAKLDFAAGTGVIE